ncbi:MAG: polyprenyl synthetase family protein [Christensenellales bacterium]
MWDNLPALEAELDAFEQAMLEQFRSHRNINAYLDDLSRDIILSGGKRLRPAMTIASAMLGQYQRDRVLGSAVSIELLHTATLVHDDIIDNSPLRRNKPTVYAREGVVTAVFTGDYLLVKSLLALAATDIPQEHMVRLAQAVEAVCVGEVEQYHGRGRMPSFKTYLSRISRKTAALFAASCALGAHLGGLTDEQVKTAGRFGGYYGIAFQIKDDLLDILESTAKTGKPAGNDLKEGVVTLPVILAASDDPRVQAKLDAVMSAVGGKKLSERDVLALMKMVKEAQGIERTQEVLTKYVVRAGKYLNKLPDTPGRDMLRTILDTSFSEYTA